MLRASGGQASVELLGVIPAVLAVILCLWQLALTGHTAALTANAARVAARAELVGRDPERAARSALPRALARRAAVERTDAGAARVRVPVPLVHPRWTGPVEIATSASLEAVR